MILPTKGVEPGKALLSIGAEILRELDESKTVSRLWSDVSAGTEEPLGITFDWFVLALDFLYAVGAIERSGGRIERCNVGNGERA